MAATILEQQQRRDAIKVELQALSTAAKLTGGKFSPEQKAKADELLAESNSLKESIAAEVADEALHSSIDAMGKELSQSAGRLSKPAQLAIASQREAFLDDPKRGFKDHRDFLSNVMQAGMTGRLDGRLKSLASPTEQLTAGSDEHGTYSDPYGGFFVPKAFSPDTLRMDPEGNPMAGLVREIPMTSPSVSFNARVDKDHSTSVSGGLRVYRRKETQTVAASRMEHEQVELKADAIFGVAYASEELLARSLVSFVALLDAGFSDEFNAKLVLERLRGTGAGEFEGALNTPSKITVTKDSGQAAATITKNNIDQMRMRSWRYGSAVWLANHGTLAMLRSMVQVIGTSGVAVPYFTTTVDGASMLDGRPLYFTEYCSALGTEGDLILANWSEFLEGTLTSMSNAESMHVRFLEHERTFKFWMENAGKWWWRAALTPRNGPTRSPVVTLETR